MTDRVLRVGTRGSALALAQSGAVAALIAEKAGAGSELVRVKTEGDVNSGPLAAIGGTGIFVTAVRAALADGRVDVIVHSFKDLPTAAGAGPHPGRRARSGRTRRTRCAPGTATPWPPCRPVRGSAPDPRGGWPSCCCTGRICRCCRSAATSTPDCAWSPTATVDAVVLAVAGLARLDRTGAITQTFTPDVMLPAPAQGALAVECRTADLDTAWYAAAVRSLDSAGQPGRGRRRAGHAGHAGGRVHRAGRRLGESDR